MMTEEFKKDSLDTYQIQQTLLYLKMLQKSSGTSDAMKKLVENLLQWGKCDTEDLTTLTDIYGESATERAEFYQECVLRSKSIS